MSGYSMSCFHSLSATLIGHGNTMRNLRLMTEPSTEPQLMSPCGTAIVSEVREALCSIEAEVLSSSVGVQTLLQVQEVFSKPQKIILQLSELLSAARFGSLDSEILSDIFQMVQQAEYQSLESQQASLKVLNAAVKPWGATLCSWVGLPTDSKTQLPCKCPTFVLCSPSDLTSHSCDCPTWQFEPLGLPSFVSESDGRMAFETGCALRLLQQHQPNHPILRLTDLPRSNCLTVGWISSWSVIDGVNERARGYEQTILKTLAKLENGSDVQRCSLDKGKPRQDRSVQIGKGGGLGFSFKGKSSFQPSLR